MAVSLDDLLNLGTNPTPEQLANLGILRTPPPQPQAAATVVKPMTAVKFSPASTDTAVKPMTPLQRDIAIGATAQPNLPAKTTPEISAPDISAPTTPKPEDGISGTPNSPMMPALPKLNAPAPGSSAFWAAKIADLENQKAHPWGTPENHPGLLGKIGHYAGLVGNIAGTVLAPNTMALIPGTALNRAVTEANDIKQLRETQANERQAAQETSEEALRKAQTENLESEIRQREGLNKQELISDAQGNVTGWKDQKGTLHSLDAPETPQEIRDIAENTANKMRPTFEKMENGEIVALRTDKDGKTASEVVYKGDPKLETKLDTRIVNGVPHSILINGKTGEDIKDLGQTKVPGGTEQAKEHNIEVVMAYDANNKAHLMSKEDAEKGGFQHITKASDKDIDNAKTHTAVLNDMQAKLNDVVASRRALDQNTAQRAIIARALTDPKHTTLGQLIDAGVMAGATPETQEYVQSVISLRESALALPKELTSGSRVSEIQSSALWHTLPSGASLDSNYALNQSKKFQGNIDRLRERVPEVRGISTTETHNDLSNKPATLQPPAGKSIVYDPQGNPKFVFTNKLEDFLKDPQYKGWSKNAPTTK